MTDPTTYYTPELKELLKKQTFMSPHTWLLVNNPVHAYLCTGDDCRKAYNDAWEKENGCA